MRAGSGRAMALLALALGCSPREARITHFDVKVMFDAQVKIDQLRFETSGTGGAIGAPGTRPDTAGDLLTSPTGVAILLPDSAAGGSVHVKVTGVRSGADVIAGEADAVPKVGEGVDVPVTLGVTKAQLLSISITPANSQVPVGTSRQLKATGAFSDGSNADLTATAEWLTNDPNVATVDNALNTGLVTGIGAGAGTTITARILPIVGTTVVSVTTATLMAIDVSPTNPSVAVMSSKAFFATGVYSNMTTQDLTSSVNWDSSDKMVATVSNAMAMKGQATALKAGMTDVSAMFGGVTGKTMLTVTAATLTSIAVTPGNPSLAKGTSVQLTATGTYSDKTTQDITASVTWASSSMAASVSPLGLVSGDNAGMAVITATDPQSLLKGTANVAVSAATLTSIAVTPVDPSIAKGTTVQLTATGTFSDMSVQDLSATAMWASSDGNVAAVAGQGLAMGTGAGKATLSATQAGRKGQTTLTVSAATLIAISVTPSNPTVAKGSTPQFAATGTYSDNSTQDLTAAVSWTSSDPSKATISNAMGSQGLASAIGAGLTTIKAVLNGVNGTSDLKVTAAVLNTITVTPANPTVAKGSTQQFAATGTYSDNSTQDLSASVTWSSSAMGVATVSNAMGSQGLATAVGAGNTAIGAVLNGVAGTAMFNVTAATLQSITVTPANASIAKGSAQQYTATGHYSDNSTQEITTQATWASSAMGVATISNAMGSQGLATGAGAGMTTISAALGGVNGNTGLTVTAAVLTKITVAPAMASIAKGTTQQFTATGTYSDNSTQDITAQVSWTSMNGGVASINGQGLATGVGAGMTMVTASKNGVSGTGSLTVTNAVLQSIGVTPINITIGKLSTKQYTATGTYSDQSMQDLTTQASWVSTNTNVATVGSGGLTPGLATSGLMAGMTVIKATVSGITGMTNLTVQ